MRAAADDPLPLQARLVGQSPRDFVDHRLLNPAIVGGEQQGGPFVVRAGSFRAGLFRAGAKLPADDQRLGPNLLRDSFRFLLPTSITGEADGIGRRDIDLRHADEHQRPPGTPRARLFLNGWLAQRAARRTIVEPKRQHDARCQQQRSAHDKSPVTLQFTYRRRRLGCAFPDRQSQVTVARSKMPSTTVWQEIFAKQYQNPFNILAGDHASGYFMTCPSLNILTTGIL